MVWMHQTLSSKVVVPQVALQQTVLKYKSLVVILKTLDRRVTLLSEVVWETARQAAQFLLTPALLQTVLARLVVSLRSLVEQAALLDLADQ